MRLELEAQAELHDARVVSAGVQQGLRITAVTAHRGDGAGAGGRSVSADGVELGVVEDVEVFPAEFEGVTLLDRETLKEAEVEVEAPRKPQVVAPKGAVGKPNRGGEGVRIKAQDAEDSGISIALGLRYGIRVGDERSEGLHGITYAAGQTRVVRESSIAGGDGKRSS